MKSPLNDDQVIEMIMYREKRLLKEQNRTLKALRNAGIEIKEKDDGKFYVTFDDQTIESIPCLTLKRAIVRAELAYETVIGKSFRKKQLR